MATKITKKEQKLLDYLRPYGWKADRYLCGVCKYISDRYMMTTCDKLREWVEKNGGTFKLISDQKITLSSYDVKGYEVEIRFPIGCKRDMKSIMATVY